MYLRLFRLPLDAAIDRLPGNGTGASPAARLFVDRADASVRAVLASILGDSSLREDAQQRRAAAEGREHALGLRVEAERKSEKADARLQQREAQAARQREQAKQRAKAQREQVAKTREEKSRRAIEAENKRLEASRKAEARAHEAVNQ